MNVPGHNQDGRGKEIVYRTSVNPWHVLFGGQNNLQCSQIIDVASSTSRGLCSVPGAHTDSSVAAAWEKAAWAIWSVREAAGKTAAGQASTPLKISLSKTFLGETVHVLLHFPVFSRVGSPVWYRVPDRFLPPQIHLPFPEPDTIPYASSREKNPWCDWVPGSASAVHTAGKVQDEVNPEEAMVLPPPYSRPAPRSLPGFLMTATGKFLPCCGKQH